MSGKFKESEIDFFRELTREKLNINELLTEEEYKVMNDHQERKQILDFLDKGSCLYFC